MLRVMKSIQVNQIVVGEMRENTYLVSWGSEEAVIIDPGDDWEYIAESIEKNHLIPKAILLTHGHFDHVMAAFPLSCLYDIPVYMNPLDRFLLKRLASTMKHYIGKHVGVIPAPVTRSFDVTLLRGLMGTDTVYVYDVPGHTPGSVAIRVGANVFSGDTIFAGGQVGRTDFSYGDRIALRASVRAILALPPSLIVYPGHGEPSIIREERKNHAKSI